jgi:cell division protein FtsW
MFLLILEQPNLSTAGTIIIVSVIMVMLAGARWKHLGILGMLGAVVGFYYAWSAEYRRERLMSFLDPFAKMSDEGYQLSQSLIAFGSGGLFGMGLGQGRQKFAYLPYPESDFIFAIVGEDFGLLGCLAVISLFAAFLFAGLRVAMRCEDRFGCLLAAGIVSLISLQAFINMGVVVGILPTTGLPLPFFSAGGTSLSITMAAVGIVLNVSRTDASHLL